MPLGSLTLIVYASPFLMVRICSPLATSIILIYPLAPLLALFILSKTLCKDLNYWLNSIYP